MSNTFELDKKYIADTYARFPVSIISGKGSVCFDEDGKRYIDMGTGIGVTAFGYSDDQWQEAVIKQIGLVQHTSNLYYTQPCIKLAEMLCERTGFKKVFFSNSGAEANECAIKAARKYAAEKKGSGCYTIVTLNNSFHGRTLTTLAATGQAHYHELFRPITPGFESIDAGDMAALEEINKKTPVAGVLIECIQGEGGVLPIDPIFIKELSAWCSENDVVFMIDEVQTGNGRTGELYAYMNFGIMPDVISTAKGLAGGLPLGATLLGEKVRDVFAPGDHGSTFGANPVCCAGAICVLSRIDEALLADIKKKGEFLRTTFEGADGIEAVSGMGLMCGLKTVKPSGEVVNECIKKGVLCLTAKDRVRLLPALNIPMELLEEAAAIIKEVCAAGSEE